MTILGCVVNKNNTNFILIQLKFYYIQILKSLNNKKLDYKRVSYNFNKYRIKPSFSSQSQCKIKNLCIFSYHFWLQNKKNYGKITLKEKIDN